LSATPQFRSTPPCGRATRRSTSQENMAACASRQNGHRARGKRRRAHIRLVNAIPPRLSARRVRAKSKFLFSFLTRLFYVLFLSECRS
jgi:hypothetical protein